MMYDENGEVPGGVVHEPSQFTVGQYRDAAREIAEPLLKAAGKMHLLDEVIESLVSLLMKHFR